MEATISKFFSKPIRYWITALIWNIAWLAAVLFVGSFLLDIIGSLTGISVLSNSAYGIALLSTLLIFWAGSFAWFLGFLLRCDNCGVRLIKFRSRAKSLSNASKSLKLSKYFTMFVPLSAYRSIFVTSGCKSPSYSLEEDTKLKLINGNLNLVEYL